LPNKLNKCYHVDTKVNQSLLASTNESASTAIILISTQPWSISNNFILQWQWQD